MTALLCPSPYSLTRVAAGAASPEERAYVTDHARSCPTCQAEQFVAGAGEAGARFAAGQHDQVGRQPQLQDVAERQASARRFQVGEDGIVAAQQRVVQAHQHALRAPGQRAHQGRARLLGVQARHVAQHLILEIGQQGARGGSSSCRTGRSTSCRSRRSSRPPGRSSTVAS